MDTDDGREQAAGKVNERLDSGCLFTLWTAVGIAVFFAIVVRLSVGSSDNEKPSGDACTRAFIKDTELLTQCYQIVGTGGLAARCGGDRAQLPAVRTVGAGRSHPGLSAHTSPRFRPSPNGARRRWARFESSETKLEVERAEAGFRFGGDRMRRITFSAEPGDA